MAEQGYTLDEYSLRELTVMRQQVREMWRAFSRPKAKTPFFFGGNNATVDGGTLIVEAADGSPSYTDIGEIRFDEADGFVLSQPGAGVARIDIAAAGASQVGVVTTGSQTFGGTKTFSGEILSVDNDGAAITVYVGAVVGTSGGLQQGTGINNGATLWTNKSSKNIALTLDAGNRMAVLETKDDPLGSGNYTAARYAVAYYDGVSFNGVAAGVDGSFTTADAKTVTVRGGIITSIV